MRDLGKWLLQLVLQYDQYKDSSPNIKHHQNAPLLFLPSSSVWVDVQPLPRCRCFSLLPLLLESLHQDGCIFLLLLPWQPFFAVCLWDNLQNLVKSIWHYTGQLSLYNLQLDKFINSESLASNNQQFNYTPQINHIIHC